ncbi:hypothetical protein H4Q26_012905 [Puccinia striiformis f. sp. tritici PST-130]|nr:hypothetical protein H4Q26_012905 [Puccinia striiformis f. sp. tritici PST-130]
MSSIITRYYLLKQLVAWHFALRMAWGQPALHGLGKSYPSEFDLYSNPEDLAQVYNLGRSHNPNRLSENQQIYRQPDLGLETLRTNSNGQGSHRLMEPEHAFPSNVVKRQKRCSIMVASAHPTILGRKCHILAPLIHRYFKEHNATNQKVNSMNLRARRPPAICLFTGVTSIA